jgi:hypothetical protein
MYTKKQGNELSKEVTRKKDGRYLIYFTWKTKPDTQKQPPRDTDPQRGELNCPN